MSTPQFEIYWNALMDKYRLPKLRPKDLRHWVSTACRKAGLTKQASNYLQGHDAQTGNMRDAYDQPPLEEWLDEQGRKLPNGPLGTLCPVELLSDRPPEAISLLDRYLAGKMGTMDFANQMESVKNQLLMTARPAAPTI